MYQIFSSKRNEGQSLIEAIVIIGVVIVLATGLISTATSTLRATQIVKNRSTAIAFAQEGIELTRALRDTSWNAFALLSGEKCLDSAGAWSDPVADKCPTLGGIFQRKVTFTYTAATGVMAVTVSVLWSDNGELHTLPLTTYMTKWK